METKIGEINKLEDVFERGKKELSNPGCPQGLERFYVSYKCKICGSVLKVLTDDSASVYPPSEPRKKDVFEGHIEAHEKLYRLLGELGLLKLK